MKIKKLILTILTLCLVCCAAIFAFSGCTWSDPDGTTDACEHAEAEHHSAEPATCTTAGNEEYWYCEDCNKYFRDSAFTQETTLADTVIVIDSDNHKYGAFVYNYESMKYVKTCEYDNGHTSEQEAGSEEYPYLVKTAAQMTSVLAKDGYIKLEDNITLSSYPTIQQKQKMVVDLNENTLSCSAAYTLVIGSATIEFKNGKIENTNSKGYSVYSAAGGNITLNDCEVVSRYVGVRDNGGTFNLNNTTVTAQDAYGIYSQTVGDVITVNGGSISGSQGINSKGILRINGSTVTGQSTAVISYNTFEMTGGTINSGSLAINIKYESYNYTQVEDSYYVHLTLNGTTINSNGVGVQMQTTKANIESANFETDGNCVVAFRDTVLNMTNCTLTSQSGAGLMGNGTTSTNSGECGINTDITLTGCIITAKWGIYLPQIDSMFTMEGGTINATNAGIEIRSGTATLKNVTITCSASQFNIAENTSGSTVTGAAVAVSQHSTDNDIHVTIDGCTLEGVYAFYEEDVMNDKHDNIEVTFEGENTIIGSVYSQNCDISAIEY